MEHRYLWWIACLTISLFLTTIVAAAEVSKEQAVIEANKYIISKVGTEYFENYFVINEVKESANPYASDEWFFTYNYSISIGDYSEIVSVDITLAYANDEWIVRESQSHGLYSCEEDKCMPFRISKEKALEIAKNNGALLKAKKVEVKVHDFGGEINSYVWDITAYDSPYGGKTIIIDINTGEILSTNDFQISEDSGYNTAEDSGNIFRRLPNWSYFLMVVLIAIITVIFFIKRKK